MRLMEELEEKQRVQEEQEKLHKKHDVEDENIMIVEKSNMVKFSVKTVSSIIRTAATIALLVLAAIGLISILYPAPRNELLNIYHDTIQQLKSLF